MIKTLFRALATLREKYHRRRIEKELGHLGAYADLEEDEPRCHDSALVAAQSALKLGLSEEIVAEIYGRTIAEEAARANKEAS